MAKRFVPTIRPDLRDPILGILADADGDWMRTAEIDRRLCWDGLYDDLIATLKGLEDEGLVERPPWQRAKSHHQWRLAEPPGATPSSDARPAGTGEGE